MQKYLAKLKLFFPHSNRGFSLIELSVVISIAASAAVGYLSWTTPAASTNAMKATQTRVQMNEIAKSIESFRVKKKRLPCPADPLMLSDGSRASIGTDYLTPTGASHDYYPNEYGVEDLDTNQSAVNGSTTLGLDCPVQVGAVPVFSLGLNESYMYDAWGRKFTYHIASTLCGADIGTPTISAQESQNTGCTDKDYQNNSGNLVISNGSTNITTFGAFAIVSHGTNGKGAFLPSGTKLANGTGNELENSDGNKTYIKTDISSTYDDLILFETKNQIESLVNRKNVKHLSVADCNANSLALSNVTLTEKGQMNSQLSTYQQNSVTQNAGDAALITSLNLENYGTPNSGDQALIGIMMATQSLCVSYYGSTAVTINGQNWIGAQCPGNNNPAVNGSTYIPATDSCACSSGLWDGNCTTTFLPSDISGLEIWLDASDASSLTTGNCSTSTAPANGQAIGCWKDKSNNSRNLSAAPTYQTNILNGKSILVFTGGGGCGGSGGEISLGSVNFASATFSLVVRVVDQTTDAYMRVVNFWKNGNVDFGNIYGASVYTNSPQDNLVSWNHYNGNVNFTPITSGSYGIYTFSADGGTMNVYKNGSLQGTSSYTDDHSFTPDRIGVNQDWGGCSRGVNNFGEILLYSKKPFSSTDRQNVESYLNSKWAVY